MPYADPDKRREYLKEWKRKERARQKAKGLRCDGVPMQPKEPLQTKEERAAYMKEYAKEYNKRPEVIKRRRKLDRDRKRARLKVDPGYKLKCNLRTALAKAITRRIGAKRGGHVRLLGCSVDFLVKYIEGLWTEGMSWDNYGNTVGTWNIDHIKPLASFDLLCEEQLQECCHYTNLQPMWAVENSRKGDREVC